MPKPAWENLDQFLNLRDFGVPAVLNFQGGGSREVHAIFDEPYLNAELGEYDMDTIQPRLCGKATDFVGLKRGDTVIVKELDRKGNTVGTAEYDVMTSPQAEGTGMAYVKLEPVT